MTDAAAIAATEAAVRAALPALAEVAAGDWVVRISGGRTKRVNSANPLVAGARVQDVLGEVERRYAAHGLPARFRLLPLVAGDADAVLADAGYALLDASLTMTAPLAARTPDPAVRIAAALDADWLDGFARASGWSAADAGVQARILAGLSGPASFARVVEDGEPLAFGVASVAGGRAMLSDIVVAPAARGRGLGRRLVAALLGWAQAAGVGESVLQVLADNAPARALYRSLGFADLYPYHYRVR